MHTYPSEATWGEWIEHLSRLAPRVLRRPDRVLGILRELAPMSSIGPTSLAEVREVLSSRLSTLEAEPPASRYGRVFIGPPDAARGRSFRLVFIPGLAERVFPQRPREDPLLLDGDRRRLPARLTTQDVRAHRERLLLELAVGAAEERVVLSYPRIDAAEARPRVPSFYGLDVMRATRGSLPDLEQFERQAAELVQARLAWPAPVDADRAIDAVEHDLSVIGPLLQHESPESLRGRARYLLDLNEHLARSLRARWQRWSARWTPADGITRLTDTTRPLLEVEALDQRAYSVTALQRYSTCPYQFLLSAIHRLEPRRDAVAVAQMDPLTRGRMIHEIQARTLATLRDRKLLPFEEAKADACRRTLDETVQRVADRYEDELAPPILKVWQDEVDTVRADLRIWLRDLAAERHWNPLHFELAFGLPLTAARGEPRDPSSRREPARLDNEWLLRGAIDLVEEASDGGSLRVTDHKTGSNRAIAGMVLAGGEILQPLLYGLAIEKILERPATEGRLSFCTSRGQFTEHVIPLGPMQRNWADTALHVINEAIVQGQLPPAPRDEACHFCDFRVVCGPHEERRSQRKNRHLLRNLIELRDIP
jgi:ATP-dependent helicase/DNAse subunit B